MSSLAHVASLFELPEDAPELATALTHSSFAHEQHGVVDNQRLEFLGDAVLGCCVAELLFARYPEAPEGELTQTRAQLVNADALADWARGEGLGGVLRLGRGAALAGVGNGTNALADAVEALIGASFLRNGLEAARRVCARIVAGALASGGNAGSDPKSSLQERLQDWAGDKPSYVLVDSGGPAHERWFEVEVRFHEQALARGRGRSKKLAERAAAAGALHRDDLRDIACAASPESDDPEPAEP